MTNTKRIGATLIVSALMMVGAAAGQELDGTLKKIKTSETFTLGYLESAPPFSFPGPDRRPVGYSIDLCTQIASAVQKQLGVSLKLNWVPVTTANRLDMVASGKVDIECGTSTTTLSGSSTASFCFCATG